MPVYEYACTACGERTEAKQSFDDPPLEECAVCGGKLRKLFSPVGIVFKGSGFYATDARQKEAYGGDRKGDTAKDDAKAAAKGKGDNKGGSKSEASPAKEKGKS